MRRFLPFAALIGVALVLGCQDVGTGPVGPDRPQFDKPTPNHDHGDDGDLLFDVTLTGNVSSFGTVTTDNGLLLKNITLNLSFFNVKKLSCALGDETGDLTLQEGDSGNGHAFLLFHFRHNVDNNDIRHSLEMDAIIQSTTGWPPTEPSTMTEGPANDGNGHWIVKASGRNHQDGCTGEGGGEVNDNGIDFLATVVPA